MSLLTILPLGYGSMFCFWANESFLTHLCHDTIRTIFLGSKSLEKIKLILFRDNIFRYFN